MRASLAVMVPLIAPQDSDDPIKKGDYLIYSVTGNVGTKEVKGALGIKIVSVRGNEFVVDVNPRSVPFMKRARLTFPGRGEELADIGGVLAGWSVLYDGTRVGKEKIPTPFGEREVEHYMRIEQLENGALKSDQFVEPVHHLPFGSRMSGKSGDVLFGLIETNIGWVRSAGTL